MRLIIVQLLLCLLPLTSRAQEFIPPYEDGIPISIECYVIMLNGDSVKGMTNFVMSSFRGISKFTMTTPSGAKRKFDANEILELGFKNDAFIKTLSVLDGSQSIKKIEKTNWKQIFERQYIIYQRALLPSGRRYVMMQTLNPGFDSRIKVFYSIGSRKTRGIGLNPLRGTESGLLGNVSQIKLTGGMQRAYWVSKNNGDVFKVKRGNYNKRRFKKLFGDCQEMVNEFHRPLRLKEFPGHVFRFDQLCN